MIPSTVRAGSSRALRRLESAVPRRALRSVPTLRSRRPRVPFVVLVSMVLVAGVVGLLLFNTSMQQASFDSSRLEEQATVLSARQEGLQMELEALRDPQRLAAQARRNGMVPARSAAFLDVDTGAVSGPKPTPATREEALDTAPPKRRKPAVLTPDPVVVQSTPSARIGDATVRSPRDPAQAPVQGPGAPRRNGAAGGQSGGTGR